MAKSWPSKSQEYYQVHWKTEGGSPLHPLGWGGEDSPFLQPPFWLSFLSASPAAPGPPAPLNPCSYRTLSPKNLIGFYVVRPAGFREEAPGTRGALSEEDEDFTAACLLSFSSGKLVVLVSLHHLQHPFGNVKAEERNQRKELNDGLNYTSITWGILIYIYTLLTIQIRFRTRKFGFSL